MHTNDIGAAIEVAARPRRAAEPDPGDRPVRGGRRRARPARGGDARRGRRRSSAPSPSLPPVTRAVVAVASGDGLVELFGNLGVQGVVTGGQTLNPSTAELLAAVEAVNADQVVVLPNNKNIIPVAEQLDALTTKTVVVVPTRSMPEALAALVVYDPEADAAGQRAEMADAVESVATGEVTTAVRDTASPAGPIQRATGSASSAATASSRSAARCAARPRRCSTPGRPTEREIVTMITGDTPTRRRPTASRAGSAEHRPDVAGRGAPRRPAAVPVPLRRRVTHGRSPCESSPRSASTGSRASARRSSARSRRRHRQPCSTC